MRKTHILSPALVCFCVLLSATARAQGPETNTSDLVVYMGEMKQVTANAPTRVAIGNPAVADVLSVGTNEIIVAGKSAGMTNLLWWDGSGERSVRVKVLTEEMSYVKSRIDDLLQQMGFTGVSTKPADAEGKVLLLGSVKTTAELNQITAALGETAKKTINLISVEEEESMVELDVEVLEVDQDGTKQLGIQWPGSLELTEAASLEKTLSKTPSSLVQISKWTHTALGAQIDFLVQEGKARILSRPKLACQSGKEAELLVGGETPVLTTQVSGTSGGTGTEVDYKEYGIRLKMAPVVTADGRIKLTIAIEVSDIAVAPVTLGSSTAPTAVAYPLSKRNTSTQLVLNDSQTLAISGLIKQQFTEDVRKVPFLGDLPLIGMLFRHRDTQRGKGAGSRGDTELVVMVTPKIIKAQPVTPAAAVKPAVPAPAEEAGPAAPSPVEAPAPAVGAPAPAAAVQSAPGPAVQASYANFIDEYSLQIAEYISEKLVYPPMAKRSKIEGTVRLALRISDAGELLEVTMNKSSGQAVLDADALSTVKEISPYPGFPAAIREKDIWIQVPITYSLAEK